MEAAEKIRNILVVGVGGQGVILASEIIADVALRSGFDVKKSEIHGMAQRGGIVSSHVRYGKRVQSPLIPWGMADLILSFEEAEALRWISFLSPEGRMIVNTQQLIPPIVSTGIASYPEGAREMLEKKTRNPILIDAFGLACELGNPRMINTILLGALSSLLELPERHWIAAIEERVPERFRDSNVEAFRRGRALFSVAP